jgi:Sensors of blue-light using FAD
MRRIIYHSFAAPELDRAELFRLVYHARVANEARGLTGVLLQSDRQLLQVLEGPTWKLIAAFEKIRRDIRHTHVEVIDERSIPHATFPKWPMRYFDDRHIGKALDFMATETGGDLPRPIDDAVRDFFVRAFAEAGSVSPSPPPVATPSSPKPC